MATKDLPLYRRQLQILGAPGSEILAAGEGGGKGYAFRVGLILYASQHPGSQCVLVHPNADEMLREHVDGPTGIKAMLAEAAQSGGVEIRPGTNEAIFGKKKPLQSRIIWLAMNKAPDRRRLAELGHVDFGCVDEAHRITLDQFELLASKAGHVGGRIILGAPEASGWLGDRWGAAPERIIRVSKDDLPADLREVPSVPTIEDFMDGLGEPRLARGSKFREAKHVKLVIDVIQRWFFGQWDRLMILMPTQLGKTTCGIRVGVPYYEYCRPYETVGIMSYNSDKAQDRNKSAKDYYLAAGGQIMEGASTVGYWKTPYGGGAWAAGPDAGAAGNPMTAGFVDDPDMNLEESRSGAAIRRKEFWYQGTWIGREDQFADRKLRQLWAATRFWRGDTCGRVLDFHAKRDEAWHICVLPALYDPEVAQYYEGLAPGLFTVEPDWRTEPGEPIWPEGRDREGWEKNRTSNVRLFLAGAQQKPEESDGGTTFDEAWMIDVAVDPGYVAGQGLLDVYYRPLRAWDLAATAGGGDWTACISMGEEKASDRIVIRHAARARLGTKGVMRMIAGTMLLDGPEVDIILPDDSAAGGKHQSDRIAEYLSDIARLVAVDCPDCEKEDHLHRGRCKTCRGTRRVRFRCPLVTLEPTSKGITARFEDFAARATPISEGVEGRVDFVDADWTPEIGDVVPWFQQAVELCEDRDKKQELIEIRRLMKRFTGGEEPDLMWVDWQDTTFREMHLFPDEPHDDLVAAMAYGWGALKGPRSVYPGGG